MKNFKSYCCLCWGKERTFVPISLSSAQADLSGRSLGSLALCFKSDVCFAFISLFLVSKYFKKSESLATERFFCIKNNNNNRLGPICSLIAPLLNSSTLTRYRFCPPPPPTSQFFLPGFGGSQRGAAIQWPPRQCLPVVGSSPRALLRAPPLAEPAPERAPIGGTRGAEAGPARSKSLAWAKATFETFPNSGEGTLLRLAAVGQSSPAQRSWLAGRRGPVGAPPRSAPYPPPGPGGFAVGAVGAAAILRAGGVGACCASLELRKSRQLR